jgi:hypothetical protein
MLKIRLHGVYNIKYAILGMQNPMNSWHLMDSSVPENGRFLRIITVCFDLTAPLYWWKEFDTCKFEEINSTSTINKLKNKNLTPHGFSFDNLTDNWNAEIQRFNDPIKAHKSCEGDSEKGNESRKAIFRELVRDLPNTYLQKRTVITNYAELRSIYFQRRNHKLDEWKEFCYWVKETLPYAEDLICLE